MHFLLVQSNSVNFLVDYKNDNQLPSVPFPPSHFSKNDFLEGEHFFSEYSLFNRFYNFSNFEIFLIFSQKASQLRWESHF